MVLQLHFQVSLEAYEGNLTALFLEHYPGMTEKTLDKIIDQARERWALGRVMIIHRVGELYKNDNIVFIGVISAHRVNAFNASQFIMDYLKKEAPFWKKEKMIASESWVAQKESDIKAADGWVKQRCYLARLNQSQLHKYSWLYSIML